MEFASDAGSGASSPTTTTIVVVRGRFSNECASDTHLWPFCVTDAPESEVSIPDTIRVSVMVAGDVLPVVSFVADYEVCGSYSAGTGVLYPKHVRVRAAEWGDRVCAHLHRGASVADLADMLPSKRARLMENKTPAAAEWEGLPARITEWGSGGEGSAKLAEAVRAKTVARGAVCVDAWRVLGFGDGYAGGSEVERVAHAFVPQDLETALASGDLVSYRGEGLVPREVFSVFDDARAAWARADFVCEGGNPPVTPEGVTWITRAHEKTPEEVMREMEGAGLGKIGVAGSPELATTPNFFSVRAEDRIAAKVLAAAEKPPVAVVKMYGADGSPVGGASSQKEKKKTVWLAARETLWLSEEGGKSNPRLVFRAGEAVVYATADPGGIEKARRAAAAGRVWSGGSNQKKYLRAQFANLVAGTVFLPRGGGSGGDGAVRVLATDAHASSVTYETLASTKKTTKTITKHEFWRGFVPLDACFAWELPRGGVMDAVVLVASWETTAVDVRRALDRVRPGGCVVVAGGNMTPAQVEAMLVAGGV